MKSPNSLSIEVCRTEGGGCQNLYGTTSADTDAWAIGRIEQGDEVTFYSKCRDLCNNAYGSVSSKENGVTGLIVSGDLPDAKLTDAPAIAVSVGGLSKVRLIDPRRRPM